MRILLTGGRLPETLHLSRLLHQLGAAVIVADSLPYNITSLSCSVRNSYFIPPAKQEPMRFAYSILDIIRKEAITLLIPTCEEMYTILRYESILRPHVHIFAPTYKNSLSVLSPFRFYQWMQDLQLPFLPVYRFNNLENLLKDMQRYNQERQYLPEWWSNRTKQNEDVSPQKYPCSPQNPWIGFESVNHKQWNAYSWIDKGTILLHIQYPSKNHDSQIPTQKMRNWVESFAAQSKYTGQFTCSFVMHNGEMLACSSTPEISQGIYLLSCNDKQQEIDPKILSTDLLISEFSKSFTLKTSATQNRTTFTLADPIPSLGTFLQHSVVAYRSMRRGHSRHKGAFFDIEWGVER